MRYSPDITKQICEELTKVPLIRHVCAKFGIDHSTFYRWMISHPTFQKSVHASLYLGREHTNGAAESVILKGVQNGEFRAASFWLTHNEPRYMQKEKGEHYARLAQMEKAFITKGIPKDEVTFEKVFEMFYEMENGYSFENVWSISEPLINLFCNDDKNLPELLKASYLEWRKDKRQTEDLIIKAERCFGSTDQDKREDEEEPFDE